MNDYVHPVRPDNLEEVRRRHPGLLLLFRHQNVYVAWDDHAELIATLLGLAILTVEAGRYIILEPGKLENALRRLLRVGNRIAICSE